MTITVTFDNLVEFNAVINNRNETPAPAAPKAAAAPVTAPAPVQTTALATTTKKPVKAEEPKAEPVTEEAPAPHSALNIEIVREKVSELTRNNKKEEVKALLETYGAKSVTLLEPAKYEAFVADLSAI